MKRLLLSALILFCLAGNAYAEGRYYAGGAAASTCSTYNLEQSNAVEDAFVGFCRYSTERLSVSTSFTASSSYTLQRVSVKLDKQGSPTCNVTVKICNDNGSGLPTTTCTTFGNIDCSTVAGAFIDLTQATIGNGKALTNGTKYHAVIDCNGYAGGDNDYIKWILDSTEVGQTIDTYHTTPGWEIAYTDRQFNFRGYSCTP